VKDVASALPPLGQIASALRDITESLAREFSVPTREPPLWGDFEWRIARAVASMQGISSLLCAGLRWEGPPSWRSFLEEQREHTAGRHRKIVQLLDRIDSLARHEEIAFVALKGAALHKNGIYQIGERPMADVDLLVRGGDANQMAGLLGRCDFECTFTTWRHQVFESRVKNVSVGFGEHTDNPIKIELHTSIRDFLPVDEIDITQFVFPGAAHAGLNNYPSVAALMMHLLLHAAGNMRAHALRYVQLHDIARLAARFVRSDWEALLSARPNGQPLWWAVPPLLLTGRYFPGAIPTFVTARLGLECPWWLGKIARRQLLADVSWSNIQAQALPGIEWSRTPRDALRFMTGRIWPSREARWELKHFAASHPGASEVPWYGISQAARIIRWIFFNPPRVQTLLSVRAALASRHMIDSGDCTLQMKIGD
jgi:putative nucleotidyltransferase-like protein